MSGAERGGWRLKRFWKRRGGVTSFARRFGFWSHSQGVIDVVNPEPKDIASREALIAVS
jgi:hypothetical protein